MVGGMVPGSWIVQEEGKPINIPADLLQKINPEKIAGTANEDIMRRIDELQIVCQGRLKQSEEETSHADKELTDIYHFIEFSNFNAAQGYQAYKALKDILLHRRAAKDERDTLLKLNDIIEKTIKVAAKKVPERTYKPRVFEDMLKHK